LTGTPLYREYMNTARAANIPVNIITAMAIPALSPGVRALFPACWLAGKVVLVVEDPDLSPDVLLDVVLDLRPDVAPDFKPDVVPDFKPDVVPDPTDPTDAGELLPPEVELPEVREAAAVDDAAAFVVEAKVALSVVVAVEAADADKEELVLTETVEALSVVAAVLLVVTAAVEVVLPPSENGAELKSHRSFMSPPEPIS